MRKTDYKQMYKELVRSGKIAEADAMLASYRKTGSWEGSIVEESVKKVEVKNETVPKESIKKIKKTKKTK
jgi:hypothetical protein